MTALFPPIAPPQGAPQPDLDHLLRDANETFRSSIQAFIRHVESNPSEEHPISHLLVMFHFQKRRMYDVTCVFTVIGACEKVSVDMIRWVGLAKIPVALRRMQLDAGAESPALTLDAIIGSSDLVSICSLTVRFLLCFLTLRMTTLDIREIGRYLSRRTGRGKSTLCKLYQIAQILEAAGVVSRSHTPGPVTIAEQFFVPVEISLPRMNPFSIEALLNHGSPMRDKIVYARRQEFFAELAKAPAEGPTP